MKFVLAGSGHIAGVVNPRQEELPILDRRCAQGRARRLDQESTRARGLLVDRLARLERAIRRVTRAGARAGQRQAESHRGRAGEICEGAGLMNIREHPAVSIEALKQRVGQEIGMSDWHAVTQGMIDRFAEVTDDPQFIHIDPVRAKAETEFGGTIAHGFLTLSLLSVFGREALPPVENRAMGINYGFDRVRL